MRAAGTPTQQGDTGRPAAAQHSKGLACSSELVGCQPSNTPGAKPSPSPGQRRARPTGSRAQGQQELAVTLRPCQGRLPRRKYINMCPNASRSSLRLCSAWRKRDVGQFPLQPLALSPLPQVLQHPMCPASTLKSRRGSLSPAPPLAPLPCSPSRQPGGRAGCLRPHTFPQVGVDAHVTRCPCQALVLSVGDVFFGLGVNILFGQAKIDDVDGVLPLAARPPHQEVLWLDISVDQAFGVDVLHPCDLGQKETSVPGQRPTLCPAGSCPGPCSGRLAPAPLSLAPAPGMGTSAPSYHERQAQASCTLGTQ